MADAVEYKSFRFTGGAASDLGGTRKRGRRVKVKVKGGESEGESEGELEQTIKKVGGAAAVFPTSTPAAILPNFDKIIAPQQPEQQAVIPKELAQQGGTKLIKVELKKKLALKKVQLNPKREVKEAKHTKKARKFVLGVSSLHKRMTRAKKVHNTVEKMPLDALRKYLIQSKLIKETSKAPEAILRQIAKDSQIVGNKIL